MQPPREYKQRGRSYRSPAPKKQEGLAYKHLAILACFIVQTRWAHHAGYRSRHFFMTSLGMRAFFPSYDSARRVSGVMRSSPIYAFGQLSAVAKRMVARGYLTMVSKPEYHPEGKINGWTQPSVGWVFKPTEAGLAYAMAHLNLEELRDEPRYSSRNFLSKTKRERPDSDGAYDAEAFIRLVVDPHDVKAALAQLRRDQERCPNLYLKW